MGGSFASRFAGVVLLVVTVGLASCQAFLASSSGDAPVIGSDAPAEDN